MQIDLPKELEMLLANMSLKLDTKPEILVLEALQEYLEDQFDYQAGIEGYQRYLASNRKGTTTQEIRKELGL